MAKSIAGTCYLKVDGEQLSVSANSAECTASDVKREAVMGSTGVAGYSEEAVAPTVTVTVLVTDDFPLEEIMRNTDMTVTVEFVNGRVFTLSGAFVSGDASYKAADGTMQLTFTGTKGVWS